MAPITATTPRPAGQSIPMKEPSLPVKLLTAGSAACVADLFTYPLDTAKVRLQVNIQSIDIIILFELHFISYEDLCLVRVAVQRPRD